MAWYRVQLTAAELEVVNAEREAHPQSHVRRKMLVLWLLHCGLTRAKTATVACLGRATVQRYVAAYRDGGLHGLGSGRDRPRQRPGGLYGRHRRFAHRRPGSDGSRGVRPDRAINRATARADPGVHVSEGLGVPVASHPGAARAAQKNLPDHVREQREFLDGQLRPRLDAAAAGREHVFFVDAAHFVFGTFLCCLWSKEVVRAASGRQRFNVLGAWNAVTRELLAITNTTVVNGETMCDLLRAIAARGLVGPVTLVLDNARYQRNALVQGLAKELGIALLFLPSYSPNLNLIERLWRFMKRQAAYGRYHPTFADFRATIEDVLGRIQTTHADKLATLMTLNFQEFEDVSLLAA